MLISCRKHKYLLFQFKIYHCNFNNILRRSHYDTSVTTPLSMKTLTPEEKSNFAFWCDRNLTERNFISNLKRSQGNLRVNFSKSSGKGGQNVNKSNTKAEMWLSIKMNEQGNFEPSWIHPFISRSLLSLLNSNKNETICHELSRIKAKLSGKYSKTSSSVAEAQYHVYDQVSRKNNFISLKKLLNIKTHRFQAKNLNECYLKTFRDMKCISEFLLRKPRHSIVEIDKKIKNLETSSLEIATVENFERIKKLREKEKSSVRKLKSERSARKLARRTRASRHLD